MFILSTTHVALAVSELLQGFIFERESTPGGPAAFYRINVFPKRKAIYIVNVCLLFYFLLFLIPSVCRLFLVLRVFGKCRLITIFFFYSYHLDTSRRFPFGTSLSFHCHKKQILNLVIGVRSGGSTLYTVVTGLYALLVYVQFMLYYHSGANLKLLPQASCSPWHNWYVPICVPSYKNYKRPTNLSQSMRHENNRRQRYLCLIFRLRPFHPQLDNLLFRINNCHTNNCYHFDSR